MEKTNSEIKSDSVTQKEKDFSRIIEKAKLVGTDIVPESHSELEAKIIGIFERTGKIFTAKQIHKLLPEKDTKYFSDKLWYLAKRGVLVKLETRGYYQIAPVKKDK